MPKYVPRPVTWAGWVVQIGVVAAIIGLIWSAPKVLWFVPIAVACVLLETWKHKRKIKALAAARPNDSICTFARSFDCRETDTWVIRAVYEQLQAHLSGDAPAFQLRREDHLTRDLGMDPDDLSYDIADEIAARTGRSLEKTGKNPYWEKIETVGDFVQFFLHQPRVTPSPAAASARVP